MSKQRSDDEPRRLTPEHVLRSGIHLHGPDFRQRLADDLGVSHKTVRAWLADPNGPSYRRIPPAMGPKLIALIRAHNGEGSDLEAELVEWTTSEGETM